MSDDTHSPISEAVGLLPELKIRLAVKHDPAWLETRVISDKHLKIIIAALESLAATGAGGDGEMVLPKWEDLSAGQQHQIHLLVHQGKSEYEEIRAIAAARIEALEADRLALRNEVLAEVFRIIDDQIKVYETKLQKAMEDGNENQWDRLESCKSALEWIRGSIAAAETPTPH